MPLTLQATILFGFPALPSFAVNCCAAPSSMLAGFGVTVTTMSLITVTVAVALFEESAWLVARIVTLAGEGRMPGAV
jgi:hypothetical protein